MNIEEQEHQELLLQEVEEELKAKVHEFHTGHWLGQSDDYTTHCIRIMVAMYFKFYVLQINKHSEWHSQTDIFALSKELLKLIIREDNSTRITIEQLLEHSEFSQYFTLWEHGIAGEYCTAIRMTDLGIERATKEIGYLTSLPKQTKKEFDVDVLTTKVIYLSVLGFKNQDQANALGVSLRTISSTKKKCKDKIMLLKTKHKTRKTKTTNSISEYLLILHKVIWDGSGGVEEEVGDGGVYAEDTSKDRTTTLSGELVEPLLPHTKKLKPFNNTQVFELDLRPSNLEKLSPDEKIRLGIFLSNANAYGQLDGNRFTSYSIKKDSGRSYTIMGSLQGLPSNVRKTILPFKYSYDIDSASMRFAASLVAKHGGQYEYMESYISSKDLIRNWLAGYLDISVETAKTLITSMLYGMKVIEKEYKDGKKGEILGYRPVRNSVAKSTLINYLTPESTLPRSSTADEITIEYKQLKKLAEYKHHVLCNNKFMLSLILEIQNGIDIASSKGLLYTEDGTKPLIAKTTAKKAAQAYQSYESWCMWGLTQYYGTNDYFCIHDEILCNTPPAEMATRLDYISGKYGFDMVFDNTDRTPINEWQSQFNYLTSTAGSDSNLVASNFVCKKFMDELAISDYCNQIACVNPRAATTVRKLKNLIQQYRNSELSNQLDVWQRHLRLIVKFEMNHGIELEDNQLKTLYVELVNNPSFSQKFVDNPFAAATTLCR